MEDGAGTGARQYIDVWYDMSDGRLSKADWIRHGLRTLAQLGPGGLSIAAMAERLHVSRGSFYWHFADSADFRAHLLEAWQTRATDAVIARLEAGQAPRERLRQLMTRAFSARRSALERAVRAWADEDKRVARAVAAADARRIVYISTLLTEAGLAGARAQARARFLYWAYLGQAIVMEPRHGALTQAALDEISALFET